MATVNPATPRQTLRVVIQEALLHDDDGDILLPLKRVRDQYTKRAEALDEKMPGTGASDPDDVAKRSSMLKNAAFYRKAADAVQTVIGDQPESLLSDDACLACKIAGKENCLSHCAPPEVFSDATV
jgi:hypothetical protein